MIILKSSSEIAAMRRAGQVVAEALRRAGAALRPGLRTADLEAIVTECFARHGAVPLLRGTPGPRPFPAAACVAVNDEVAHGLPGGRELRPGDLVSVDTACRLDGWCADAAWTWPVGEPDEAGRRLLAAGRAALDRAIAECGRCGSWSEVAAAIESVARAGACSVIAGGMGHGIGRELHEDPQVPNSVTPELARSDFRLEAGLVLAIEPMLTTGSGRVQRSADGWTVTTADGRPAVHFEHTVAITGEGTLVLTAGIAE